MYGCDESNAVLILGGVSGWLGCKYGDMFIVSIGSFVHELCMHALLQKGFPF